MTAIDDPPAPNELLGFDPPRQSDTLYHDLLSPSEVTDVRARVRSSASRVIAPIASRIARGDERIDGFPRDAFDSLAREGLYRIPFSADVGGDDLQFRASATAAAVEELAYYSNSVAAIFDVHCILAGNAVNQGTDEQRCRWLAPSIAGDIVGSFATSEPGASSDLSPSAVATEAIYTPEGWLLNGRKRWITNSVAAAYVVVLARTGHRLSTFIVPTETAGVAIGTPDRKLGNKGQIIADVILDDVLVGQDALLGHEGGGLKIALQTLTYGRIGIAAAGVGMAQAAFDHTAKHLTHRHAFGGPLASKQHWQFLMADRAASIESARTLYIKAALRLDSGTAFPEPEAAMAKLRGTEIAVDMARDAVQAFGGLGFTQQLGDGDVEGPVEALYRDSKIGEIYEGATRFRNGCLRDRSSDVTSPGKP